MAVQNSTLLPINQIYDPQDIISFDLQSPEFKEFLVQLYHTQLDLLQSTNKKTAGVYDKEEVLAGNTYFPGTNNATMTRSVIRKTFKMDDPLPNAGLIVKAHGINFTATTSFVRIYACATKLTAPRSALPIPYVDGASNNRVGIIISPTEIQITTNYNATAYTEVYVVLEYIRGT